VRPVVAFALIIATVMSSACQDTGATPPISATASADTADQTLFGVRLTLADRGVQRALLEADTAFTYEDNSRTELRKVRSTFYTETGLRNGTLTSREGTYNVRSQNMEARGNVVVVSDDGRRLETPQLKFDTGRNEISGDSAFVMTRPGDILSGIGFVADPALTHIRVLANAHGRTTKSVAQPDR
jgi:LPS export ABC transporter protein LptC